MKTEAEIRAELLRRQRLLEQSSPRPTRHMAVVDNQSAVMMLEWVLHPNIKPRYETFGEGSVVWWKRWWRTGRRRERRGG